MSVIGTAGIEAQTQDTDTLKLAYDFDNGWQATYTASVFHQTDDAGAQTWLRNTAGTPVYAGNTSFSASTRCESGGRSASKDANS